MARFFRNKDNNLKAKEKLANRPLFKRKNSAALQLKELKLSTIKISIY